MVAGRTACRVPLQAEEALHNEGRRVGLYLNASSEGPLLRVVEKELLSTHEARLLEKEAGGLRWLLRNKSKEDLARLCVHPLSPHAHIGDCGAVR